MAQYEFVVDGEGILDIPIWDELPLLTAIASFHEWMNYALSHDQRLEVRLSLHRVDDPGG